MLLHITSDPHKDQNGIEKLGIKLFLVIEPLKLQIAKINQIKKQQKTINPNSNQNQKIKIVRKRTSGESRLQ